MEKCLSKYSKRPPVLTVVVDNFGLQSTRSDICECNETKVYICVSVRVQLTKERFFELQ